MKNYDMLPDTDEEEKAIGGILTFKQFFCLLASGMMGGVVGGLVYNMIHSFILFLIVFCIVFAPGVLFAFYKIGDMSLMHYLWLKHKFNQQEKIILISKKGGIK